MAHWLSFLSYLALGLWVCFAWGWFIDWLFERLK